MSVRIAAPARRRGVPAPDRTALRARAERALAALCHASSELSLLLVDDARMAELNAAWRGQRRPTDVLAFPLQEGAHAQHGGALLGDVVISLETAGRQARSAGRPLDDELGRLLVHGLLHLVGHDHARPAERRAMQAEERRLRQVLAG